MRCVKSFEKISGTFSVIMRRFRINQNGAIAPIFALLIVPLLFAMMLAVDTANLMRVRGNVQNALDAAALAVGKRFTFGSTETEMQDFGAKIFNANLHAIQPTQAKFTITFPQSMNANQQIVASADFPYTSFFGKAVKKLTNGSVDWDQYSYNMSSTVRLKNTIEVALVLDNSGSMTEKGSGSGKQRIELLKSASSQLVTNLADQAKLITNLENPVQFSLVPFAGAVNIGPNNKDALWMDQTGISPVHYENFTMPTQTAPLTIATNKQITNKNNVFYKTGSAWGADNGKIFNRFSLYNDMKLTNGKAYTTWQGCVESRPGLFGINAAPATVARPESMYVPMFGPSEYITTGNTTRSHNGWWPDISTITGTTTANYLARQKNITRYYTSTSPSAEDITSTNPSKRGPNYSCTTAPLTELTDITTTAGMRRVQDGIKAMIPSGGTNVPEGMVWGWRTLIANSPFAGGRPSNERGNDKVVIVLTDGANTYYQYNNVSNLEGQTPPDNAGDVSYYSTLGYVAVNTLGYTLPRIFQQTTGVNTSTRNNANYTEALNSRFKNLCELAKNDNIMIMTVALDLKQSTTADKKQMDIMKECASDSRVRKDQDSPTKAAKLFWNTTGGNLEQTFKEIADELSNLRVVR